MSIIRSLSQPSALSRAVKSLDAKCTNQPSGPSNIGIRGGHGGDWNQKSHSNSPLAVLRRSQKEISFEDKFISSLVTASTCRTCLRWTSSPFVASDDSALRGRVRRDRSLARTFTSSTRRVPPVFQHEAILDPASVPPLDREGYDLKIPTKQQYESLVSIYEKRIDVAASPSIGTDPPGDLIPRRKPHFSLAHPIVYTAKQEEALRSREILDPEDRDHSDSLDRLYRALGSKAGHISLRELWNLYLDLRAPRLRYISDERLRQFFRHLSWVETKDFASGQRYLELLKECLGEGVQLSTEIWNTAISFAGKQNQKPSTDDIRYAVEMWLQMEEYGQKADSVTFNTLFDIAVKSRRFALANTIFREIQARGLPLSRFLRAHVIYYAGLRADGNAVRQAFQDLVDAGEIVDTTVMNVVIISLIRAGEAAAAEHVFLKMKRLHESQLGVQASPYWQERKALTIKLNKVGKRLRHEREHLAQTFFGSRLAADDRREAIQSLSSIAPDAWTYGTLIKWHTTGNGNLTRASELIEEMREHDLMINNAIYIVLFRGFTAHGGHAYTDWNRRALEDYWSEFLHAATSSAVVKFPSLPPPEHTLNSPTEHISRFFYDNDPRPIYRSLFQVEFNSRRTDEPNEHAEDDKADDFDPDRSDDSSTSVVVTAEPAREHRPPHFTRAIVSHVLRAFWTCAGRPRMQEVWMLVQERWHSMTKEDRENLQRIVDAYVKVDGTFLDRR